MDSIMEQNNQVFGNYYNKINDLILKTKQNVAKNINYEMVELYFEIGSTINELIENYNLEASQNKILKLFYRAQAGSKPQAALTKRAETCIIKE